jgi:hypothetical protein
MFFSRVATALACAAAVAAQATPLPTPTFSRVLDGIIVSDASRQLNGTIGQQRLLVNFVS